MLYVTTLKYSHTHAHLNNNWPNVNCDFQQNINLAWYHTDDYTIEQKKGIKHQMENWPIHTKH